MDSPRRRLYPEIHLDNFLHDHFTTRIATRILMDNYVEMQLGSKIITTLQETVSVTGALVKLDHVKACMFFKTFGDPCVQERAQRWLCGSGLPGYEVGDPKLELMFLWCTWHIFSESLAKRAVTNHGAHPFHHRPQGRWTSCKKLLGSSLHSPVRCTVAPQKWSIVRRLRFFPQSFLWRLKLTIWFGRKTQSLTYLL